MSGMDVGFARSRAVQVLLASLLLFIFVFFQFPRYLTPPASQMAFSFLVFISILYCAGYTVTKGIYDPADSIELHSVRLGMGLAMLPVTFVLLETASVAINWKIVLGLYCLRPIFDLFTTPNLNKLPKIKFDTYSALAVLISVLAFTLAMSGSYQYSWLEDGDPWEHAVGAKYVSIFESYTQQSHLFAHYLPPIYPPGYDVLMGIIHQTNDSVSWTLKTFNALLVGLTYLFAFFFFKKAMRSSKSALVSQAILFTLPGFASHSIWAHTLSACVFFVVFYALETSRKDPGWILPSVIALSSSLLIQPLMSAVMGIFFILYLIPAGLMERKKAVSLIGIGALALTLSLVFWVPSFGTQAYAQSELNDWLKLTDSEIPAEDDFDQLLDYVKPNAQAPSAMTLFFPRLGGDMFMQHGFGLFVLILLLMAADHALRYGLVKYIKQNPWFAYAAFWMILSFIALLSFGISLDIYHARFWGIGAIPLAMLSGNMLANLKKIPYIPKKNIKILIIVMCIGIFATSMFPKISVQTAKLPTDLNSISGDFGAYKALMGLPANTPVYSYCTKDAYTIGYDKMAYPWDEDFQKFRAEFSMKDPEKLNRFLRGRGFRWIIFDTNCIRQCNDLWEQPIEECRSDFSRYLESLDSSGLFKPVKLTPRSQSTMMFELV